MEKSFLISENPKYHQLDTGLGFVWCQVGTANRKYKNKVFFLDDLAF